MKSHRAGLALILLVVLAGGMVFWMFQSGNFFGSGPRPKIEIPVSQSPMQGATDQYRRDTMMLASGGTNHLLTYYFLDATPAKDDPLDQRYPLVVVLHGSTGNAYAAAHLAQQARREKYKAFVLVPVIPENTVWAFPDSVPAGFEKPLGANVGARQMLPFVEGMIKGLLPFYPIDTSRIYVVGCSMGGFGAFGAVRDYPHVFAAAVSISGGWSPDEAQKLTRIPVLAIHGKMDANVPAAFSREVTSLIPQYGGKAYYTELSNMAHQCPMPELYDDYLWNWLFRHQKTPPASPPTSESQP